MMRDRIKNFQTILPMGFRYSDVSETDGNPSGRKLKNAMSRKRILSADFLKALTNRKSISTFFLNFQQKIIAPLDHYHSK